nr:hypersensitive to pi starvation 4 [Ipomoea batatas]
MTSTADSTTATSFSSGGGFDNLILPISSPIYDFDRDYKDVGVARFTTKYFVVRNCLPNAKSDMLLSAWNPPEWGKNYGHWEKLLTMNAKGFQMMSYLNCQLSNTKLDFSQRNKRMSMSNLP